MTLKTIILFTTCVLFGINYSVLAQSFTFTFGSKVNIADGVSSRRVKGEPLKWVNVNTASDTWSVKIIC